MKQYKDLITSILTNGKERDDRTGVGTISIFSPPELRFKNIAKNFPLVTLKTTWWKGIVYELLWMLHGDTNIKFLNDNKVFIWDEWADSNGDLGPVYGAQWRAWGKSSNGVVVDQISNLINEIKTNPLSRRLIINAWNVSEISLMALPPCHVMAQFYVDNKKLSCKLTQRSGDCFLGVPFNIASYSLLTMLLAQVTGLTAGDFVLSLGDAHIYKNHISLCKEMIEREPYPLPKVELNCNITNIDNFKFDDIFLINYKHHPTMKADVAV